MNVWLTVPTRFDRPSLWELLKTCGIPPERQVIICQNEPKGIGRPRATVLRDYVSKPNIHRWWNGGINYAQEHGADVVIVVNDDVVCHEPLTKLAKIIEDLPGTTITQPAIGRMCGWCFALNLHHDVRPDEGFQWWFGDNDMWERARLVVPVAMNIEHLKGDDDLEEPWMRKAVERDAHYWFKKYGEQIELSQLSDKFKERV